MSHRVLKRRDAAIFFAVLFGILALAAWFGLEWIDSYSRRASDPRVSLPAEALADMAGWLRIVAVLNGLLLLGLAAYLCRQGIRGVATRSMPPAGTWIIEGQKVRTGHRAVLAGRLVTGLGVLLILLAIASSILIWRLANQVLVMAGGG